MATDRELLEAWQGGDTKAADQLLERHFACLRRFYRNKIDRDVDELIQETLNACVGRLGRWTKSWTFRAFLLTVAKDRLVTRHRFLTRSSDLDAGATSISDLGCKPPPIEVEHEEERVVLRALRHVPIADQITLELHYFESMSSAELAQVLGIPELSVSSRLQRAQERMRKELSSLSEPSEVLVQALADVERWARSARERV